MCLNVTAESLNSVLNAPWPPLPMYGEAEAPFIVAVTRELDAEDEQNEDLSEFPGYFNVAIETILTEFFSIIGDQLLDPFELGGHLKGKDIWFDIYTAYRE